jgi:hypothetical protein
LPEITFGGNGAKTVFYTKKCSISKLSYAQKVCGKWPKPLLYIVNPVRNSRGALNLAGIIIKP